MKNLFLLLALITTITTQARSLYPEIYKANILTEQTTEEVKEFISGEITVNKMNNTVTLDLLHAPNCKPHMFCIEIVYIEKVELPIVRSFVDACGGIHYVASRDDRPVDGIYEYLKVSDYTNFVCPTFQILPHTGIEYQQKFFNRIEGVEVVKENYYTADQLELAL